MIDENLTIGRVFIGTGINNWIWCRFMSSRLIIVIFQWVVRLISSHLKNRRIYWTNTTLTRWIRHWNVSCFRYWRASRTMTRIIESGPLNRQIDVFTVDHYMISIESYYKSISFIQLNLCQRNVAKIIQRHCFLYFSLRISRSFPYGIKTNPQADILSI